MKENILILGGDKRQLYAANRFSEKGYNVGIYGFSQLSHIDFPENFNISDSLYDAIKNADIIVLPMPVSRDNITLNAPLYDGIIKMEDIFSYLKENKKVYGGMVGDNFLKNSINITDYAKLEELLIKNAALTAEGTLSIIITSTPFGIMNERILLTGYGRIGKILARYIKALGGIPVVCARNEKDFSWCDIKGIEHICYEELKNSISDFKVIVNTVPYKVITKDIAEKINPECFFVDLASKGGGVDFETLEKRNIRYTHALGIPGKYSSKTAGEIVSDVILKKEKGLKTFG